MRPLRSKNLQVLQFFEEMLRGAGPEVAKRRDGTILKEILDKTTERISNNLTNQPEVEAEVRYFAGKVYRDLGDYQTAELMQRRVVALQRRLHPKGHADVADALSNLGILLMLLQPNQFMKPYVSMNNNVGTRLACPASARARARNKICRPLRRTGQTRRPPYSVVAPVQCNNTRQNFVEQHAVWNGGWWREFRQWHGVQHFVASHSAATDTYSFRSKYYFDLAHQCRRVHFAIHHEPCSTGALDHRSSGASCLSK